MTDKEKLEKIVAYLIRRMYAHNQMADIGSTGEIFDEKIENAKYEECRDTLNFIDSLQEEKDLNVNSLTWEDIRLIAEIGMEYMNSEESDNLSDEDYYQNILNRVKEQKGKSL